MRFVIKQIQSRWFKFGKFVEPSIYGFAYELSDEASQRLALKMKRIEEASCTA
jgi:hypothetical protein